MSDNINGCLLSDTTAVDAQICICMGLMVAVRSEHFFYMVCTADMSVYQSLKLVGHRNITLFRIRHDGSISLMLAFVKVSLSEFNSFIIILFLLAVYCFL